jgi:hypothetical protein
MVRKPRSLRVDERVANLRLMNVELCRDPGTLCDLLRESLWAAMNWKQRTMSFQLTSKLYRTLIRLADCVLRAGRKASFQTWQHQR